MSKCCDTPAPPVITDAAKAAALFSTVAYRGPAPTAFQLIDIDAPGMNELVAARGTDVAFWPAVACPCSRTDSGKARRRCQLCNGYGFAYPADMRCDSMRVLLQSQTATEARTPAGGMISGRVVATFPSSILPQPGDLVLPKGQVHQCDEVLLRGRNPVQDDIALLRDNNLAVQEDASTPDEALRYPEILQILGVWGYNHLAGGDILRKYRVDSAGDLTHDQTVEYQAAVMPRYTEADYTLAGNVIRWNRGRGPALGTQYTVKYRANAVFIVGDEAPYRSDRDTPLQRRVSLVRYDAVGQDERLKGIL